MSLGVTAQTVLEVTKHAEIKRQTKTDEDGFARNCSGTPYLLFKRTGAVGLETKTTIGTKVRLCVGKGNHTDIQATDDCYRGRTASETFIILSIGKLNNIPRQQKSIHR